MTTELDEEQRVVVDAAPQDRLLVVAGAGRGKTEVVAQRIAALQADHGLSPSDDVLVLSFSRAAVRAIHRRLDGRDGSSSVRTFDSMASRLLLDADQDVTQFRGFEARIRAATELLASKASTDMHYVRHLILDEVQDLVGDRAEFALALVAALSDDAGFTALGDPLQAIYDWQLEKSGAPTTSDQLMRRLEDEHGAHRVALSVDYRARGSGPLAVVALGNKIRAQRSGASARESVIDLVWQLDDLGPLRETASMVPAGTGTTAVLCRTNAEALFAARFLREHGVAYVLRRPAEDVGAASWIAVALGTATRDSLLEGEVREMIRGLDTGLDPDDAWAALKAIELDGRSRHNTLNLAGLRRSMRARALPLELLSRDDRGVVVSTIHRAKGLEFDRVLVVDRRDGRDDEDDWIEARTQYVALSRARDELFRCQVPHFGIRMHKRSGRWAAFSRKGLPYAMETRSIDTDVVEPLALLRAGTTVQDRLRDSGIVGAEIVAVLEPDTDLACPRYELRLVEDATAIGRTSERFGLDLIKVFGPRRGAQRWPAHIRDIFVASVETVAGAPADTRFAGLGASGLWLVPRLEGLARPDFAAMTEEDALL